MPNLCYTVDKKTGTAKYRGHAFGTNTNQKKLAIASKYEGYPVTRIGVASSYENSNMKSVVIPSSITIIETDAFYKCASLESVSFPSSMKIIYRGGFNQCYSLETIILPDTFINICDSGFYDKLNCFDGDDMLSHIDVRFGQSDDWFGTVLGIFDSLQV